MSNPFAECVSSGLTESAAKFVESVNFSDVPEEALRIGKRCVLDGLALMVAGSDEESVGILIEEALDQGGKPEALLFKDQRRVPAAMAARVLGTAGHAHDWDDTQVSWDPRHVYGLLTHPTIPPLTAALVLAQRREDVSGKDFMLAFLTGFEVECKLSEYMLPQHYQRGMHSSGTVGTLGAFATSAKLIGLTGSQLRSGFGIAASMAAGIRCQFGTMTKPLHVGRAAENGVTAAFLAQRGFGADLSALDGPWGFMAVHGGGVSSEKLGDQFGKNKWSIVEPGVSIKPYPCGVLTHPTIDLMLKLVLDHDVDAQDIESVQVHAGSNILKPIRYPVASNHLEAKFSLPATLAMIALARKAGKTEFSDQFVASEAMQLMQRRIETKFDADIEALGFDKMRSRINIVLKNGNNIEGWANEKYRGGPQNPLTDNELRMKARQCCHQLLSTEQQDELIDTVDNILQLDNVALIAKLICTHKATQE